MARMGLINEFKYIMNREEIKEYHKYLRVQEKDITFLHAKRLKETFQKHYILIKYIHIYTHTEVHVHTHSIF